jgi:hypothetical protein
MSEENRLANAGPTDAELIAIYRVAALIKQTDEAVIRKTFSKN